jgi:hypothetical protein
MVGAVAALRRIAVRAREHLSRIASDREKKRHGLGRKKIAARGYAAAIGKLGGTTSLRVYRERSVAEDFGFRLVATVVLLHRRRTTRL